MLQPQVVLASASPRRARLLEQIGVRFEVVVSNVDETLRAGESAAAAAERLARAKALHVAATCARPVIAADTVVACDGQILGKPGVAGEAVRMLRLLAGRTHQVVTGVCVARGGRFRSGIERTDVTFAPLSDSQIEWYVSTGEPLDKAGAYHVDGRGALFIERVEGSPSNVAGLPVALVRRLAGGLDVTLGPP